VQSAGAAGEPRAARWRRLDLRTAVLILIVAGILGRALLALWRNADPFDISAQATVSAALLHHPATVYSYSAGGPFGLRIRDYPYPAGYFPVLALVRALSQA
jgi:hypothetical protein